MREYKDKQNAQRKHYYDDRFLVVPNTSEFEVAGSKFEDDVKFLQDNGITLLKSFIQIDQLVLVINPDENLKTLQLLKEFGYEQLNDISAVDFLATNGKFEIFYQLLSLSQKKRVRVECFIEQKQTLKSVTSIYKSANWAEREMYDMFGVLILDHPNLRRILMPDDWYSHPLLKSYPLHGDEKANWYEIDRIFGKEHRAIVGEENRDSSFVDDKDTFNFARLGAEVPYGTEPTDKKHEQEYQEEGGVAFVKKVKRKDAKILRERP